LIRDNRELSNAEKYSLLAFMHWCLITPQGTSGLKQQLSQASEAIKEAISHILVTVALSDGKIELSEIKQLEKLYTMMGLEKKHVTEDLHVLSATTGPVTVGLRDPDTSFSIPKDKSPAGVVTGFSLNQELIKIREEETRLVKGVLEGIFSDQDEVEPIVAAALATAETTTEDSDNPLSHLDAAHQAFFNKLLEQETWERASLYEACKNLGLMFDGAMEVINEWAFEHVNAPLIEDGEPVYVDVNLAKELTGATV
jgi:hypothetical protein